MSYLVFARKCRPQNFAEVIGQEHIATTLKNAITLNRVAHAYLFSGPRGVGKTSTARILAKALNCEKGPTPTPCNICSSCTEISEGRSLDVMEIDGASNRGIEQVRQLRESVKFSPAKGRFKIYIIDEVHQITTDGFNALLKTLEEPPAHVKFIFATTQAHKVLATILSRCQRFDFRPLTVAAILEKLKTIVKAEKLDISEEALLYIARSATGSMRDAESILDQLSSFSKGEISLKTVTSVLGMIDQEALWEIAQAIIEKETVKALTLVEKIIKEGKDLAQFNAGLMEHFRNILVAKIMGEKSAAGLIDLAQDDLIRISAQGKDLSFEEILYIVNLLTRCQESLRRALSGRVIVEMAIIRLAQRENLSSLEKILTRLNALEQNLGREVFEPEEPHPKRHNPGANPEPVIEQANPALAENEANPALTEHPANPAPTENENARLALNHSWQDLLQAIKETKMFLASSLEFGRIIEFKDTVLVIGFPQEYNFYKETLAQAENKKFIEEKAKEVFQQDLKIKLIVDKSLQPRELKQEQSPEEAEKNAASESIVQSALKVFQGRIIRRAP